MALQTFVKVNAVTNLSDARYCAGMYVNVIGFDLEQNSKNFTSPQKFNEITGWLSGVDFVGEFNSTNSEGILTTIQEYQGIEFIEIQDERQLEALVNTRFKIILKVNLTSEGDLDSLISKATFFRDFEIILHLTSKSLNMTQNLIQKLGELAKEVDVLIGFDMEADSVLEILSQTKAKGISLQGTDEIKPGIKDFDQLADILEVLEVEE